MTHVQRPLHPPHRCSFTLKDADPEGFIQGQVLSGWDPSASISVGYLKQEARKLGMVDAQTHALLVRELNDARAETNSVRAELDEALRKLAAVDLLESAGFTARKKPGRPATTTSTTREKAAHG